MQTDHYFTIDARIKQTKVKAVGIEVIWDNDDKTIVRHVFRDPWTNEAYNEHVDHHYAELDKLDHIVDVINDLRDTNQIPANIVTSVRRAAQHTHPNEGIIVMVGAKPLFKSLIQVMHRVADSTVKTIITVETMPEAYKLIAAKQTQRNSSKDKPS